MKFSETRAEIFKAYVKTKGELEPLFDSKEADYETKKGGKIQFSYAELPHIYNNIDEILAKNGIGATHDTYTEDGKNYCNTFLLHESGEYIESGYLIYDEARDGYGKPDLKANNAMFTTMKRMSVMSTMGIASEKETQQNLADRTGLKPWQTEQPPPPLESNIPEPESFTKEIKDSVIWTEPKKQGEIHRLLHKISTRHGITEEDLFDRLQAIYKTSYDIDHMNDRAAEKYIAILVAVDRTGKNPMMKTKEEWGHKNEEATEDSEYRFPSDK